MIRDPIELAGKTEADELRDEIDRLVIENTRLIDRIDQLDAIARKAGQVVLETPRRGTPWQYSSYVRRALIAELEAKLIDAGYDMVAARARMK